MLARVCCGLFGSQVNTEKKPLLSDKQPKKDEFADLKECIELIERELSNSHLRRFGLRAMSHGFSGAALISSLYLNYYLYTIMDEYHEQHPTHCHGVFLSCDSNKNRNAFQFSMSLFLSLGVLAGSVASFFIRFPEHSIHDLSANTQAKIAAACARHGIMLGETNTTLAVIAELQSKMATPEERVKATVLAKV